MARCDNLLERPCCTQRIAQHCFVTFPAHMLVWAILCPLLLTSVPAEHPGSLLHGFHAVCKSYRGMPTVRLILQDAAVLLQSYSLLMVAVLERAMRHLPHVHCRSDAA